MKNYFTFLSLSLMFTLYSCSKDSGTVMVTYFEATAIYGNLDDIRLLEMNSSPSEIINPGKIYIGEKIILIGEEGLGIHVLNNENIANPVVVNFINIPGNREYLVKGDYLYAESYYDVIKIDISNPLNVVKVARAKNVFSDELFNDKGETLLGFQFNQVSKEVDEKSDLFHEIKQSSKVYLDFAQNIIPQSAVPSSFSGNSSESNGTINRIAHYANHVYVIGRNDISIIADDADFSLINKQANFGNEMETIFPYKNKLFIGTRSSMDIYDVSLPNKPIHEFKFDHATSCDPVLPHEGAAYVSLRTADFSGCPGNTNALITIDINDLSNPFQVGEIEMRSPYGMTLINDMLYIGEGENGITIFDARDPLDLIEITHNGSLKAYDIIAHPTRKDIILIAGPNGLAQYQFDLDFIFNLESIISF